MAATKESCYVTKTKGFFDPTTLEYQEVYYYHETGDGQDTKTEFGRGTWQDTPPHTTQGECGTDFKA